MPTVKTLVCLANSRKLNDRCVAGVELGDCNVGGWIRPVGAAAGGALSESERQYSNGTEPSLLDIMTVPLLREEPHGHQQENWLVDPAPAARWSFAGRLDWDALEGFVENPDGLWGGHDTYHGISDILSPDEAAEVDSSLRLIYVRSVELRVLVPQANYGNHTRRVQARFAAGGQTYWLWVTDPVYEDRYKDAGDGPFELGECYLTVSIGEPFKHGCSKLVAGIMERALVVGR